MSLFSHHTVLQGYTRRQMHTTSYKQGPTIINIDRPAYTKMDKQYRTHKTYYSMATRQLRTALKDKDMTYDRLRNNKPITTGSGTL